MILVIDYTRFGYKNRDLIKMIRRESAEKDLRINNSFGIGVGVVGTVDNDFSNRLYEIRI